MAFSVTRVFNASPEAVYDCWVTKESFASWFGGAQIDVPLDKVTWDCQEGGSWSCTMVLPDGSTIDWVGEFRELRRPSRIVLTMNDDPSIPQGEAITVDIVPVAGGTELTMHQDA